jgi:enoyl-CoA hydratase/carnithine racemase
MAEGRVRYECRDRIGHIVFDRPEKLNAFDDDMVRQLAEAVRTLDADEEALVGILSGEGRAFSSGADVFQRQLRPEEERQRLGGLQPRDADVLRVFSDSIHWKPMVAAVHGYALGLALGLVLECELVVATEDARFQVTEISRGIGAARFVSLMQFRGAGALATDVGLTGRYFTGKEAAEAGLINRAVPAGRHLEVAEELATQMAQNPPLSVRATVRARRWYVEQLKREAEHQMAPWRLHLTEDFRESARAFAEGRPPNPYLGR